MKKVFIILLVLICGGVGLLAYDWHVKTTIQEDDQRVTLYSWTDEKGAKHFTNTQPPDGAKGVVLDGRDIGTVVCPAAHVKIFVTARPDIRAERRHRELIDRGEHSIYARVLEEMTERDRRDAERAVAPLKAAEDAVTLDTSDMSPEQALSEALAIVASKTGVTPPQDG